MIEYTLWTYVQADTTVANLISARMYPLKLPQSPALPAIVYTKISGFREHDMDGSTIATPRVQYDSWADTYVGAKALADALRERLDSYTGPVGSPADTVHFAYLLNERDFYDDDLQVFRVSMDFE
ncbi:hypothetical protein LCGC14_2428030, partial [marine sediment metagenome]